LFCDHQWELAKFESQFLSKFFPLEGNAPVAFQMLMLLLGQSKPGLHMLHKLKQWRKPEGFELVLDFRCQRMILLHTQFFVMWIPKNENVTIDFKCVRHT
jgi:hypothetical protein